MATETELTFVRCPSCRSLVPAVSTRCRMCGAGLDGEVDDSGSDNGQEASEAPAGRVRQRTMSEGTSDLNSAASQVRGSETPGAGVVQPPVTPAEVPVAKTKAKAKAEIDEDPLSQFIEEVEITEEDIKENSQAESQKVIVESGARRAGQASALSFGKGGESTNGEGKMKAKESAPIPKKAPPPPKPKQIKPESKAPEKPKKAPPPAPKAPASPPPQQQQVKSAKAPKAPQQEVEPQSLKQTKSPTKPAKAKVEGDAKEGRLFGWLVTYSDPNGASIELREGQFFVSKSELKGNDFIIDHESISTPHAMLRMSADGGCQVQDVMSDNGVFLKKASGGDFARETESVTVEHGDWVRFGDVEYLVCLIAHVGVK